MILLFCWLVFTACQEFVHVLTICLTAFLRNLIVELCTIYGCSILKLSSGTPEHDPVHWLCWGIGGHFGTKGFSSHCTFDSGVLLVTLVCDSSVVLRCEISAASRTVHFHWQWVLLLAACRTSKQRCWEHLPPLYILTEILSKTSSFQFNISINAFRICYAELSCFYISCILCWDLHLFSNENAFSLLYDCTEFVWLTSTALISFT